MPLTPNNNSYRPPSYEIGEQWKVVDRFDSTYWSGQDVRVYANNIRLEEAVQVSYQIIEPIRPVYGYASYVADRMVHGQRLIVGELSVNFKKDGYIFSLISALKREENWLTGSRNNESNNPVSAVGTEYGLFRYDQTTIDAIRSGSYKGRTLSKIVDQVYNDDLLDSGGGNYSPIILNEAPMFRTKEEGFDLNITYGTQIKSEQVLRFSGTDNMTPSITNTHEPKLNTKIPTGLKIIGVSLGGVTKVIGDDGRPIMESYTFQARNIQVIKFEDLQN